jgi:hypothetical protein
VAPETLREVDAAYGGMTAKMTELLSTYTAAEFAAVVDFIERTTQALTAETARLTAKAPLPGAVVSARDSGRVVRRTQRDGSIAHRAGRALP